MQIQLIVAVGLHGGMFVLGNALNIPRAQISWLAREGFVVVAPDFRLCPHSDVWSGPVHDCIQLYSWIVSGGLQHALEEYLIQVDIDRIVIFGYQSGGTLAQILVCLQTVKLMIELHLHAETKGSSLVLSMYAIQCSMGWTAGCAKSYA
jgi:acetyl esterase/lipase